MIVITFFVLQFIKNYILYRLNDKWTTVRCADCIREMQHMSRHTQKSGNIDEVGNPLYNVREAAKQCEALEDHLEHANKRCNDCIRKHFLMIEVLLEEAISLDRYNRHAAILCGKPERVRRIIADYNEHGDHMKAAQQIRDIRKQFVSASFNSVQ
jgi:hypothetical protein